MNRVRQGFTLVELLVIIGVIGILATIVALGLSRFQMDTRDAQRTSDITSVAEALEKYYDEHGEYPSCTDLKAAASTVAIETLPGINKDILKAPSDTSAADNSIKCTADGNTLTVNGADFYEYTGDGSSDCASGASCLEFTLKYKEEASGEIKTISSRRKTNVATAGDIQLSGSATGYTTADLSWTAAQNATSYTLQRALDSSFSTGLAESSHTSNNTSVSGLSQATTYHFRVKGTNGSQSTNWSNVVTLTTPESIGSPTILAVAQSTTSLNATWSSVSGASSYRLEWSTSSSFSPLSSATTTSTSRNVTGLDQGRIYYFRVFAMQGAVPSNASPTYQQNTTIQTPSAPSVAPATNTDNGSSYTTTWTWTPNGTCPANTTMQYQRQYTYNSSSGYTSSWSSPSTTTSFSVTTSQGYTYTAYVQARCRSNWTTSIASDWSSSGSRAYTQAVTPPTNLSWSAYRSGDRTIYMSVTATCRTGASRFGHFDEYSGSLKWTSGPNSGNYGWYTPGGYRITNAYSPSGGSTNPPYAIPNGAVYTARTYLVCRNSVTGLQSSGVSSQGPTWIWGSNV